MNRRIAVLLVVAALVAQGAYAGQGNPQGKGGQGQSQVKGQGQSQAQGQGQSKAHDQDQGQSHDHGQGDGKSQGKGHDEEHGNAGGKDNHGQVVSDCNHRANERKLEGNERQDFVEWCTDSSERHGYDDRRWNDDRTCYERADKKGLSGDARRNFVRNCADDNYKSHSKESYGGKEKGSAKDKDD